MSTTITSGRIDLYGSRTACDQERVSRTMPAILSGRITTGDWEILCDNFDEVLKPTAGIKKLTYAWNAIVPLVFIVFLLFGFLGFASDENEFIWAPIIVIVLIIVLVNLFVVVIKSVKKNKIRKKLIDICDKTSASHPGISFHVRYEERIGRGNSCGSSEGNDECDCDSERRQDYIEVCVAPVPASSTMYTSSPPPIAFAEAYAVPPTSIYVPSTTTVVPSAPLKSDVVYPHDDPEMPITREKKTAEERMKDLDGMKDIITEEEYYRKRAEILSDI